MTILDYFRNRLQNSALLMRCYSSSPRLFDFLFSLASPAGRPLAVGLVVAALGWFAFFGVVQDYLAGDALVLADLRVMYFVQTLREPAYNSLMLFLTYLGNWQVIAVGSILFTGLMYLSRQWWWLSAFATELIGEQLLSQIAKLAFHRARPNLDNALLPAAGSSFPSGHALVAFGFYGFIACYAFAQSRSWWGKTLIFICVIPLILEIGVSRVYLGVHWPSDVVASFALGPAWVATILTVFGFRWRQTSQDATRPLSTYVIIASAGIWLGVAIAVFFNSPLNAHPTIPKVLIALDVKDSDAQLFDQLPRFTEDFTGAHIEPINVVIVSNESDLNQAFAEAGWKQAAPISISSGLKLVWAEITSGADSNAPGMPVFLNSQPNDKTFERPTEQNSARERHHLHLWTTDLTDNGISVWVGTVHLDISGTLYRRLTYHMIAPDVDQARVALSGDLQNTHCVSNVQLIDVTSPLKGQNIFHNPFFTDGKAVQLDLKCK